MNHRLLLRLTMMTVLPGWLLFQSSCTAEEEPLPNIIYILADDLGYGDVSAFNPEAAWKTSHIDAIAGEGMFFSDAHSGSAVCTPTRYGILTGNYAWRTRLKNGVLWSYSEPLIGPDEMTVGKMLQKYGYTTACVGKWHLGLDWAGSDPAQGDVDFNKPVGGGPNQVGFDYFFGITASLDIPPYVYIENDRITAIPDRYTESSTEMGWWRNGPTGADFQHEEVLDRLTEKAVNFIEKHYKENPQKPFFLYFPLTAPHTPILPLDRFRGSSGTNDYGDFVLQVDWTVGEILKALNKHQLSQRTLIIFTSDNGCSPEADFEELAQFGHDPSGGYRGAKADIFEGGHRIPFIVRWPGKVSAGSSSAQTICLTDLMATAAAIVGDTLPGHAGADSYNLLPILLQQEENPLREATVHHSVNGSFAIRRGDWKLILCPGSGGWSPPIPESPEVANLPPYQLYNLARDPGESSNLYPEEPEIAEELRLLLEKYKADGRSTPTR
jgi:arylsulfatase A-like enzyme